MALAGGEEEDGGRFLERLARTWFGPKAPDLGRGNDKEAEGRVPHRSSVCGGGDPSVVSRTGGDGDDLVGCRGRVDGDYGHGFFIVPYRFFLMDLSGSTGFLHVRRSLRDSYTGSVDAPDGREQDHSGSIERMDRVGFSGDWWLGLQGLSAAIQVGGCTSTVLVVTKEELAESNTAYAQGGIAVAMGGKCGCRGAS